MSILKQITDDISALQAKIPEDLFKIKQQLSQVVVSEGDVKKHPYVIGLLDKNRVLRKKVHTLEKQLLNVLLTGVKGPKEIIVLDHDESTTSKLSTTPIIRKKSVEVKVEKPIEVKVEKPFEKPVDKPVENITILVEEEDEEEDPYEIKESTSFSYPYPRDRVEPEYPPKKQSEIITHEDIEEVEEFEESDDVVELEDENIQVAPAEEQVEVEEEEEEEVEEEEEEDVEEEEEEIEIEEEEEEIELEEEEEEIEVEEEVERIESGVVQGAAAPAEPAEEEEESVYEVTIKGKTYYVMNETDSVIYDVDENGDISLEVGIYKQGKPVFYKKK